MKESPGCLLGGTRARRVPRRPLWQRERQGEAGSEEGACAPILQKPSKDKAESERSVSVCVGRGAAGSDRSVVSP